MQKINYIKINNKQNWLGQQSISINNIFLDEDWNKFNVLNEISSTIQTLSTYKENLASGNISSYIEEVFNSTFPNYVSSFNEVLDFNHTKVNGISTIKINNIYLQQKQDQPNSFLTTENKNIVNTFNNLTGNLYSITSIKLNNITYNNSNGVINLGNNYLDLKDQNIVLSINKQGGSINVVTSIIINGVVYKDLDNKNNIKIQLATNQYFKRKESLDHATISSGDKQNSIVNREMFDKKFQYSSPIKANKQLVLENVIDWISIVNNDNIIKPISATLVDNTLRIKSPSAGIIYYIKK